MSKGISTSSIGLITVLGIAIIIGWMTYQSMAGTAPQERITDKTSSEQSRELLETVKRTLKTDLIYSSQEASLDVAIAGGGENCGVSGTRYWIADGKKTIPTEEEVLCSLSNTSLANMNEFVKKEKQQYASKGVQISKYNCVGSYNPSEAVSSPYLERKIDISDAFQSGLTGGSIDVTGKGEQKDRYDGNIMADAAPNQFWPIYYTLANFVRDDFNIVVTSTVRTECTDDTLTTGQKIIDGVEEACKKLREEFCGSDTENCCIKVNCVIECPTPDAPVTSESCYNSQTPEPFNKKLCFEKKHTDGDATNPSGLLVAQGSTTGSYRVKIDVIDECHKINAKDYLDWRLYIVDTLGTNCEVVD